MEQAKMEAIMAYYLKQNGLTIKTFRGREFVCRRPDFSHRVLTPAQMKVNKRFSRACDYAEKVMADPRARAPYEMAANEKKKSLRHVIIADFLNSFLINEIDLRGYLRQAGNTIAIRVDDYFKVVGVHVAISAPDQVVEFGEALRSATDPRWWIYTASTTVPTGRLVQVAVTARDRPGNRTTRTEIF